MDKKTAQKLLHRHLQAVLNESTAQTVSPFRAVFIQFVLSEGTDRQSINNLCYDITALLGQVAIHLRHVDLNVQNELTIKAIVQRSVDILELEHMQDIKAADTLAIALVDQLSSWGDAGASGALAQRFGEALTVVAQILNCVNNHAEWKEPPPSLLAACEQAIEHPESDWQVNVMRALGDDTWGKQLQELASKVLAPEHREQCWRSLETAVQSYKLQKCSQCYAQGSVRYSCGEYAGRYCDEHWETAGFRPADDRLDYLDAGEYATEEEAY
jgi:hypothetical protein